MYIYIYIFIYLLIYNITQTNNTSPCPNEKLNIICLYASQKIFKVFA